MAKRTRFVYELVGGTRNQLDYLDEAINDLAHRGYRVVSCTCGSAQGSIWDDGLVWTMEKEVEDGDEEDY